MKIEELLAVFAERFTPAELAVALDMLTALLNVQVANASMGLADAQAAQAAQAAEAIRQKAQAEANAAQAAFAALVAKQAAA